MRQVACTLGPKLDQRKQLGKLDQPFGFLLLGGRKWRALILAIESFLKPGVHSRRQPEPRKVVGDVKFDRDHGGHEDPPSADSNLILPGKASERILFHDGLERAGAREWRVAGGQWSVNLEVETSGESGQWPMASEAR